MNRRLPLLSVLFLLSSIFSISNAQILTATILQGDTIYICSGSTIQIDGSATGGTAPYVHWWTGSQGFASSGASTTLTPIANMTLIYNVTDSLGNTASDTLALMLKPVPNITLPPSTGACINSYINTITFSSSTPGATFNWTNSNPAIGIPASGTGTIPSFLATVAGIATITVTPTANGCSGTPSSFSLTIAALPTATINVDPDTICAGSAAQISISLAQPGCTFNWAPHSGLSSWVGNPVFASPATSTVYTLTLANSMGCTSTSTTVVYVLNCPKTVTGSVFHDDNHDGIRNIGETGAADLMIKCMPDGLYAFTDTNGFYSMATTSNPQTITLPTPPLFNILTPSSHTASFTAGQPTDSLNDFALYALPNIRDLAVTLTEVSQPSSISNAGMYINYANNGTDTLNAMVRLIRDTQTTLISATPAPSVVLVDTLTWNLAPLLPHSNGGILATFGFPANTPLGTILHTTVMILPVSGDTLPDNNTDTLDQVVAMSYDPNDKTVSPSGPLTSEQVLAAEPLTYTVRFQNTGTAPAVNIVIKDTISGLLNFESVEMIAASHPYTLQTNGNKLLTWTFNNINLPDSNANEAQSHGFVKYRIRPLPTLSGEDTIKNTAYIYFDYNAPVATNTVMSYLESIITGITGAALPEAVRIYPNPAGDEITIEYDLNGTCIVKLYDIAGALHLNATLNSASGKEKINLSALKNGFYLFTVAGTDGQCVKTGKLILER